MIFLLVFGIILILLSASYLIPFVFIITLHANSISSIAPFPLICAIGAMALGFYLIQRYKTTKKSQKTNQNETVPIANVGCNNSSTEDELAKYLKMFEQGLITQEEYEAKKKQILGL